MVVPLSRNVVVRDSGNTIPQLPSMDLVAPKQDELALSSTPRTTGSSRESSVTRWDSLDNALAFAAGTPPKAINVRRQLAPLKSFDALQLDKSTLSFCSSFEEEDSNLASPVSCVTRSPQSNTHWGGRTLADAVAETGEAADAPYVTRRQARWKSLEEAPGAAGAEALRSLLLPAESLDAKLHSPSTGSASTAQNGHGQETWADGAQYNGEYRNGNLTGTGHFSWPSGSRYEGEFLDGRLDGSGRQDWPDGSRYEGQWKNNQMDGFGKFTWSDGRMYEGWYRGSLRDGEGVFTWPDGRRFEGQWKEGKQHGIGKISIAKGKSRVGEWKHGERVCWFARV